MRTQDPSNIRIDFDASLADVRSAFTAAEAGIQGEDAKKLIAEYLFVAVATLFEGFVSDLFVAYINRRSESFRKHLLSRMSLEADDEVAKRAKSHVELSMPHLSVEKIRGILDPAGYNVTFATTDAMKQAAGTLLSNADKVMFTKTSAVRCAVIDFITAVRNYLAHRSDYAFDAMQTALSAADLPPELKRVGNKVNDVGAYLRAKQKALHRFEHVLTQVQALAAQFKP